jgi:hypothetical protein
LEWNLSLNTTSGANCIKELTTRTLTAATATEATTAAATATTCFRSFAARLALFGFLEATGLIEFLLFGRKIEWTTTADAAELTIGFHNPCDTSVLELELLV